MVLQRFRATDRPRKLHLGCGSNTPVVRCPLNHSGDPQLVGLENVHRIREGFLELETLTLEATRGS